MSESEMDFFKYELEENLTRICNGLLGVLSQGSVSAFNLLQLELKPKKLFSTNYPRIRPLSKNYHQTMFFNFHIISQKN